MADWTAWMYETHDAVHHLDVVRSLEVPELQRAFAALVDALLREAQESDPSLARRLARPLGELVR